MTEATEPSQEDLLRLWSHVQKFVEAQRIWCAETVYQSDRVIVNAYEFIHDACEIVGYFEREDED